MNKVTIAYTRTCSCVSADPPECWITKEEDLCIQQRNFRVEHEEPEPPQTKEEQEEPEPPQIKEEPGELCISQDEDQLDLKQETDTLMEIPTYEEDENSEADLNNQQSFNKEEKLSSIKSGKNSRLITNPSDYMETGSDERFYICKECGKSFCNKFLFRIHARIHGEDEQFSCEECNKSFSRRFTLKTHMITHTGEKPFSCKECK
uniref:C2H2-type domain-containing protein n=1 Tax=Oryzias sinensis TaxID=183150 RepID=A0A8C7YBN2_9TELE